MKNLFFILLFGFFSLSVSNVFAAVIDDNVVLNAFRIAVDGHHSILKMKDGVVDVFKDKSGIDKESSFNLNYNAARSGNSSAYYSPAVNSDMVLISQTFHARSNVSKARVIVFMEDIDSVTEGIDIKVYVSRDDTFTWDKIPTLTDGGDYDHGKRMISGNITAFTSSANNKMVFKIETAKSKNMKIYGVGFSWE